MVVKREVYAVTRRMGEGKATRRRVRSRGGGFQAEQSEKTLRLFFQGLPQAIFSSPAVAVPGGAAAH